MITIKQGLDIPISGAPEQKIENSHDVKTVALIGPDYHGMKPTMTAQVGDKVALGQPLFEDKKNPGVIFTAPAAGTLLRINRGERRVLKSVVIEVDDSGEEITFDSWPAAELADLDTDKVKNQLVQSGLWVAFRTRPFSKVPALESRPANIFVTATDTNPLAVNPALVISDYQNDFSAGVSVLSRLTEGRVFVCTADIEVSLPASEQIQHRQFRGMHPAGNAGTHIHCLSPASSNRTVWHIGYQDVIAIGKLFLEGRIWNQRILSVAGPQVERPAIIKTRLGANIEELCAGNLKEGNNRLISGSVLNGRTVQPSFGYLGRYHLQVTALLEGTERPMLHYCVAGRERFSALPIYLSRLMGKKRWNFTTTTNGSERAMVPVGAYEQVMPLDILPTQLLRMLIVGDTEMAQKLGALELDEEDLALCTFVCPGKYEYGPLLRDNLERIEKEG